MFYPEEIVNNDCLRTAWQAGNDMQTETICEYGLPEICRNLDTWISSEALEIRQRLSLRTSATLIGGAAMLYKADIDKLLEDTMSLDAAIAGRKRKYFNISSSSGESESAVTPEQTRRVSTQNFRSSISPVIRTSTISTESIDKTNHEGISIAQERASTNTVNQSPENFTADRCSGQPGDMNAREVKDPARTFIAFPTVNRTEMHDDSLTEDGLDKNLPFAYIMVFNNHSSRIPSKLIMSSINSNIKKRIIFVDNV